jgi:hypothetical protein
LQIVPEIRTALPPTSVTRSSGGAKNLVKDAATAFAPHPENLTKNVKGIMEPSSTRPSGSSCTKRRMPKLVIRGSLILVHENFIGLSKLLKFLFGR